MRATWLAEKEPSPVSIAQPVPVAPLSEDEEPICHEAARTLRARRARELAEIHNACCRHRRQGLVCSTCTELNGRAEKLEENCG